MHSRPCSGLNIADRVWCEIDTHLGHDESVERTAYHTVHLLVPEIVGMPE